RFFRGYHPGRRYLSIEDIDKFRRVRAIFRPCDQMFQRVLHRAGFRVARVKEHQHQVRQVDDVVGDPQSGPTLIIGVKAG
ncbi:MAG: hypothetical protein ACI8R4_004129, partial [Paracoccaceae bacterium]